SEASRGLWPRNLLPPRLPGSLLTSAAQPHTKSRKFTQMAANKKLLILAGDGIGVEVMGEVERLLGWFEKKRALRFDVESALCGGAAIDKEGKPVSDATVKKAAAADAVLFGAVGGPKWDNLPFEMKPERGLLRLR